MSRRNEAGSTPLSSCLKRQGLSLHNHPKHVAYLGEDSDTLFGLSPRTKAWDQHSSARWFSLSMAGRPPHEQDQEDETIISVINVINRNQLSVLQT
jgi:hypothetical protein